jgi:hypothetical protein
MKVNQASWNMAVIPALRRLRQEDYEFEVSLFQNKNKNKQTKKETVDLNNNTD